MNTSTNETAKGAVCHHGDLLVTPVRIWQFSVANLTKKNSETIDINLETKIQTRKVKLKKTTTTTTTAIYSSATINYFPLRDTSGIADPELRPMVVVLYVI